MSVQGTVQSTSIATTLWNFGSQVGSLGYQGACKVASFITSNGFTTGLNGTAGTLVIIALSAEAMNNGITSGLINVILNEGGRDIIVHYVSIPSYVNPSSKLYTKIALVAHGVRIGEIFVRAYQGNFSFPKEIEVKDLGVHVFSFLRNIANFLMSKVKLN